MRKEIISSIANENNEDAATLRATLGDSDNFSSATNFMNSGDFIAPTAEEQALPEDILPPLPVDCDDSGEATSYEFSVEEL